MDVEIKKIVQANSTILSEIDPKFFLRFTDIRIGKPSRLNDDSKQWPVTPNECRLRDASYCAPVLADISYWRNSQEIRRHGVEIGRLPIMLRSSKCVLADESEKKLVELQECPLDPGGYFVVNGTEKVILVQEQLSKNRVIVDEVKDTIMATVTR